MFYKYSCSCTIAVFISLISKNSIMITNVTQKVQRQYIFFDFKNILPFNNCFLLFSPFPSLHSPFEGSQRQLGMCTARAEYVRRERFVSFSSLSPFGGSGAYRINDSSQFPLIEGARERFLLIFRHTPSQCLCPKAQCLFPFLSPRNPVFFIFILVVSYYESTIYTPFLYQSSKIRISFL